MKLTAVVVIVVDSIKKNSRKMAKKLEAIYHANASLKSIWYKTIKLQHLL